MVQPKWGGLLLGPQAVQPVKHQRLLLDVTVGSRCCAFAGVGEWCVCVFSHADWRV